MQFLKVDVASGLSKEIYSRMMLCGQFATGKTTISKIITKAVKSASAATDNNNNNNTSNSMVMISNKSTIGVDVIPIEVNATTFAGEKNKAATTTTTIEKEKEEDDWLHLQIWDFAGRYTLILQVVKFLLTIIFIIII